MLHRLAGWIRSNGENRFSRRRCARFLGRSWARVAYGYHVEPTWLEVNHLDIPVRDLPLPFHGFRIVQLSDFHCGRQVTTAYLDEAVRLAQAQAGHLIVLTGDFIHQGFKHVDCLAETLGRLQAPHGVYAVLGNHDFSVRNALGYRRYRHLHHAVDQALTARGIRVLRNEAVELRQDSELVYLTGVEDLWSRVCDLDRTLAGLSPLAPCIMLAHNPCTIEHLDGRRCDLMLSGHTHGGQVHLPGIGRPTLSKRARRYAAGLYRVNDTYLYVNKGVGFGIKFRYGVRPEVAVTTLQPV